MSLAAGNHAAKGDDFKRQAEKKLKSFGFFSNKYEDAAEYFEKAGNAYKLAKAWTDAAECFGKLADCHIKSDSRHEAASSYVEAAKMASKSNAGMSAQLLEHAIALYVDMGRLGMAARQLRELAETSEKQGQKEQALGHYEQAADMFETDGSSSEATKCRLKIAEFSAELGQYPKAVEMFEEALKRAVGNNLLKFSARGYILNAGICLLCYASPSEIERKLDDYRDIDMQFPGTREEGLLQGLLEAMQKGDDALFATHLAEFDSICRLDNWKTKILLQAKRRIQDMELGVGGNEDKGGGDSEEGSGEGDNDDDLL